MRATRKELHERVDVLRVNRISAVLIGSCMSWKEAQLSRINIGTHGVNIWSEHEERCKILTRFFFLFYLLRKKTSHVVLIVPIPNQNIYI